MATPNDSAVMKQIVLKDFINAMETAIALTSPLERFLNPPKQMQGMCLFGEDLIVHKDQDYEI
jgi:hypothetical protein